MAELVQVKAEIPRELKRRTFAALALNDEKFSRWLRVQMEAYLQGGKGTEHRHSAARLVGTAAD